MIFFKSAFLYSCLLSTCILYLVKSWDLLFKRDLGSYDPIIFAFQLASGEEFLEKIKALPPHFTLCPTLRQAISLAVCRTGWLVHYAGCGGLWSSSLIVALLWDSAPPPHQRAPRLCMPSGQKLSVWNEVLTDLKHFCICYVYQMLHVHNLWMLTSEDLKKSTSRCLIPFADKETGHKQRSLIIGPDNWGDRTWTSQFQALPSTVVGSISSVVKPTTFAVTMHTYTPRGLVP